MNRSVLAIAASGVACLAAGQTASAQAAGSPAPLRGVFYEQVQSRSCDAATQTCTAVLIGDGVLAGYGHATEVVQRPEDVAHAREEPEWLTRHLELATLLFMKGDRAACAAELEKMTRVYPEEPALLFDLGACREGMGDLAGAQDCYRRAFALPGASPELLAIARRDWGSGR